MLSRRLGRRPIEDEAGRMGTLLAGGQGNVIRERFAKALTDNVATDVFTITTPADNRGGGYSCAVHALIFDGIPGTATANAAAKSWTGQFCRAFRGDTGGVSSAVSEDVETASAATTAGTRDIGTVTMSTVENSEYAVAVRFLADHIGTGTAELYAIVIVELVWYGFLTPPALAAA